jgi:hypothetical protein
VREPGQRARAEVEEEEVVGGRDEQGRAPPVHHVRAPAGEGARLVGRHPGHGRQRGSERARVEKGLGVPAEGIDAQVIRETAAAIGPGPVVVAVVDPAQGGRRVAEVGPRLGIEDVGDGEVLLRGSRRRLGGRGLRGEQEEDGEGVAGHPIWGDRP